MAPSRPAMATRVVALALKARSRLPLKASQAALLITPELATADDEQLPAGSVPLP